MGNTTKITCPVCGAEFAIAEHTHVSVGIAIGKDAGLGEIHPELAKKQEKPEEKKPVNKAAERLQALKDAGVDVTNLFAMQGASGDGMIARMCNGTLLVVPDDDPIFAAIKKSGTVPDRRLFRRWVTSQMFHMLTKTEYGSDKVIGFTEALHRKGYKYQFEMLRDELKTQAKLYVNDSENYIERNRWFNKGVVLAVVTDYFAKLTKHISGLKIRKCKGKPYIHMNGVDIFVEDVKHKLLIPINMRMKAILDSDTPSSLARTFENFNRIRVNLPFETPQCADWVRAYKGAGAYYTMKNLILFSGGRLHEGPNVFDEKDSLRHLDELAILYSMNNEGWKMFACMKKFLLDNNLDPKFKLLEWEKEYRSR